MEIPSVASQLEARLVQVDKQPPNSPAQPPAVINPEEGRANGLEISPAGDTDKGQKIDTAA
jgi:hypothetical protein